ncbi:MAG: response regulator [Oscillatoriales cyanobacterium SM2_2_1]|nr:response regulator [Oscillatoriales cyanobacterium SM2_2_1]
MHVAAAAQMLREIGSQKRTGRLQFWCGEICWIIRFEAGTITYATHNLEPFDRLGCHLRRLSVRVPAVTKEFRVEVCRRFEDATDPVIEVEPSLVTREYEAIAWMFREHQLEPGDVVRLVQNMTLEAIEHLLWNSEPLPCRMTDGLGPHPGLCQLSVLKLLAACDQRLKQWQLLAPYVTSPYQRPYYFPSGTTQSELLPELQLQERLSKILKGFSFRHLAAILGKDELRFIGGLIPYIAQELVMVRDPQTPYHLLPPIPKVAGTAAVEPPPLLEADPLLPPELPTQQQTFTLAWVDDSPAVLAQAERLLGDESFKFVGIHDPLRALTQLVKLNPDVVLLDVEMPKINGYELCRLLRNNRSLKDVPIIMVTGKSGILDRTRAKLSGCSDFLAKPFTQESLLKMVFRYLG